MASPFARETKTVDIPFDPGQTVTVRQLSGRQLEKASKEFLNKMIADVQARGGAKVQKELNTLFGADESDKAAKAAKATEAQQAVEAVKANPLNGYDLDTLIRLGVMAWSYPDSLTPVSVVEQTDEGHTITVLRVPAIDTLTEQARKFFATEVLQLTRPDLFVTPDTTEAAQKNA